MEREKNPAAVELGKRRAAKMTTEDHRAAGRAGAAIRRALPPEERRAIARRAARTRKESPAWLRRATKAPPAAAPEHVAHLERAIDHLDDENLAELYAALVARFGV